MKSTVPEPSFELNKPILFSVAAKQIIHFWHMCYIFVKI